VAADPRLLPAPAGTVERKRLRLKVLRGRQHELEAKDDGTALRAVAAQVEELEAEIAASEDCAAID
jgi:hypothetical protein